MIADAACGTTPTDAPELTAASGSDIAQRERRARTSTSTSAEASPDHDGGSTDYFLDVHVNGQPTGRLARFTLDRGRWFIATENLRAFGIAPRYLPLHEHRVALDTLDDVGYTYNPAQQTIDLQLPDDWRTPYRLGTAPAEPLRADASNGWLVNYDGYVQRDTQTRASIWTELRGFRPGAVVSTTGIVTRAPHRNAYRRLDTYGQHDDPATLTSWQVGDAITGSLAWTRSVRIAGLQWRRNFALRPDLVTFPVPALRGSAVVPSSVDLYLDGIRRFSGHVPPGPFVWQDVPGLTGDLQANLVTRDALGREQIITVPLYIDPRLLAAGLSSFSIEAGLPRHAYGERDFGYRGTPVASLTARHGMSDTMTIEGQAQAGKRLASVGAGALVALRRAGVASVSGGASTAGSDGHGFGTQWSVGYQYLSRRFGIDALVTRTAGRYRDLASLDGVSAPTACERLSLSMPWGHGRTVSFAYFGQRVRHQPATKVASMHVNLSLGGHTMLSVGGYRDLAQHGSHGVFAMLSVLLGDGATGAASVTRQGDQTQTYASAARTPDYGGGWGWQVLGGQAFRQRTGQAQVNYLGQHGEVAALVQRVGAQQTMSLSLNGALVAMDGSLHATRRVFDAFALVSTDGTPDVPVLREYVPIGRTDGRGYLLVPDLSGFEATRVGIDPLHLPADVEVRTTQRQVLPEAGAGVLARFPVTRYRAAQITLVDAKQRPLTPGSLVRHLQSGFETVVGYDGEAFVEDLRERNTLEVSHDAARCRVSFEWTPPAQGHLARLGPRVCMPVSMTASP